MVLCFSCNENFFWQKKVTQNSKKIGQNGLLMVVLVIFIAK